MQEKHLYEYSVVRLLPVVEREEFMNVGVIMLCKKSNFIRMHFKLNEEKLKMLSTEIDIEQVKNNLKAFQSIAEGKKEGGAIAQMDVPSRFRWLTAVRSSLIQTSRPHPGLCEDLEETSERLFRELVL